MKVGDKVLQQREGEWVEVEIMEKRGKGAFGIKLPSGKVIRAYPQDLRTEEWVSEAKKREEEYIIRRDREMAERLIDDKVDAMFKKFEDETKPPESKMTDFMVGEASSEIHPMMGPYARRLEPVVQVKASDLDDLVVVAEWAKKMKVEIKRLYRVEVENEVSK